MSASFEYFESVIFYISFMSLVGNQERREGLLIL
jgi:hypothetical protein